MIKKNAKRTKTPNLQKVVRRNIQERKAATKLQRDLNDVFN
jgi:hypothetical protein